ncbi:unnamed protein product [Chrysoparadoxa australica]
MRYHALLRPSPSDEVTRFTSLHCSENGVVACGCDTGEVHVFEWRRRNQLALVRCLVPALERKPFEGSPTRSSSPSEPPAVTCVRLAPDASLLAAATSDGLVIVMRAHGEVWHRVSEHAGSIVECLLWNQAADRLYSGCQGGKVAVTALPKKGSWGVNLGLGLVPSPVPKSFLLRDEGNPVVQLDVKRVPKRIGGGFSNEDMMRGSKEGLCDMLLIMTKERVTLLSVSTSPSSPLDQPVTTASVHDIDLRPVDLLDGSRDLQNGGCLWSGNGRDNWE